MERWSLVEWGEDPGCKETVVGVQALCQPKVGLNTHTHTFCKIINLEIIFFAATLALSFMDIEIFARVR